MKSILSYPDRGPYGKSNYRGNCSGYVVRDLIQHFRPSSMVDVCEGGGTSGEVCLELGVSYVGLDLHKGFDFTRDSVLKTVGHESDLVFSHPPYHSMIDYRLERKKHGLSEPEGFSDLSACVSVEEFLEKAQVMLLNQREATTIDGIYTTLIGDMRKDGKFHSFQADFIKMLPQQELLSVAIKAQHNTVSGRNQYQSTKFISIEHEYLIIWKKQSVTLAHVAWQKAKELQNGMHMTWRSFVRLAMMNLGGEATLDRIYSEIEKIAGERVKANVHYREKVRQTLQKHFSHVSRGVWSSAA